MLRSERWASWAVGLIFGVAAGLLILLAGASALVVSLAALALAFVVARSLAFISGALLGVGGSWIALAIGAQSACETFNAISNQGCQAVGIGPFVAVSAVITVVGLAAGSIAWRRRAARTRLRT